MLLKVDVIKTVPTTVDFIKACAIAWKNIYGVFPQKSSVAIIYAQTMTETSFNNLFNWNFGNIKAIDTPGVTIKYMALSGVWEIIGGKKVEIPVTNPGSFFRAFDTIDDGMDFYMNFLRSTHYKSAWYFIENGDPAGFVHALKTAGYFTASEADYLKGVQWQFNVFMNGPSFDMAMKELETAPLPNNYQPLATQKTNKESTFAVAWKKIKNVFQG